MPLGICTYLALMPGSYPDVIQFPDVVLHVFAFTPDRRAEILDLLWDTIGIGVGQVFYWGYIRIRAVQLNRNRLNDG